MAAFKKRQGHLKHTCLPCLELKFLPTLWRRTIGSEPVLAHASLRWFLDHDPSSTFRTGDARAHNAIRHPEIIFGLGPGAASDYPAPTPPSWVPAGGSLWNFEAVRNLASERRAPTPLTARGDRQEPVLPLRSIGEHVRNRTSPHAHPGQGRAATAANL